MSTLLQDYFQHRWVAVEYLDPDSGEIAVLRGKVFAVDDKWIVLERQAGPSCISVSYIVEDD